MCKRKIKDENGVDIKGDNVFVVEPYDQDFSSGKASLLLVNKTAKNQYDDALLKIEKKKKALFKGLKKLSGLSGKSITPESELLKVFGGNSIFDLLDVIEEKMIGGSDERLSRLTYSELFNEKTTSFLESGQIKSQINEYIEKYNQLVDESPILRSSFTHYNANSVHKSLSSNGFFSANHSINLFSEEGKEEITSAESLRERIEEEKKKILSNEDLAKKFEAIDKKLANAELRKFRDYLFNNRDIVTGLLDYRDLQKSIWVAYLSDQNGFLSELLEEYKKGRSVIEQAVSSAKDEKTEWEEVVNLFNKRFSVPFKIEVSNQEEVILKGAAPQALFTFCDGEQSSKVERGELLRVLSQGEKRALYILNILFELNARKKNEYDTLLLIDDIADSFDYKNKYAIVEYLQDISKSGNFCSIFLTHNFDFHRTVSGRLNLPRKNRLFAVRNGINLSLAEEKYQNDPFEHWKNSFCNNRRFVISAIPFVRNLAK